MKTSRPIRSHMATGLTSSLVTAITVGALCAKPPLHTLCARIAPSVVSIQTYGIDRNLTLYPNGTGTGFYYKGAIITNAHVLDNAFKITIDHDNESPVLIKKIDYKHDIAIIEALLHENQRIQKKPI
jgi:S1-C subfamily serine protease